MIPVGTVVEVKEGANIKDLYGMQEGELYVIAKVDGWGVWDIWVRVSENPHINLEPKYEHHEELCIATSKEEFDRDFRIISKPEGK
ncbi:hypothetical protein KoPa4_00114 [Pseudomonas phage vB_PpuM-KoPa-4]|uniref:Uncharacterized protein n=1 Tax=Pseudomonas phage vB_PpuM-KoPa-4 TaxID=3132618 RepID=A0AAX4MXF8_9CAUD